MRNPLKSSKKPLMMKLLMKNMMMMNWHLSLEDLNICPDRRTNSLVRETTSKGQVLEVKNMMVLTIVRSLVISLLNVLIFKRKKIKNESFQKNNLRSKFKRSPVATWEELGNKGEDEEVNLAFMASTFLNSEFGVDSDSESEDTEHVFYNLSKYNLSTLCHDLMERCQQKVRHIKTLKKGM